MATIMQAENGLQDGTQKQVTAYKFLYNGCNVAVQFNLETVFDLMIMVPVQSVTNGCEKHITLSLEAILTPFSGRAMHHLHPFG